MDAESWESHCSCLLISTVTFTNIVPSTRNHFLRCKSVRKQAIDILSNHHTSLWRVGRGRGLWERREAGGVNDNEWHLHHSPVSSPTEELWKDKRRSEDSGRWERSSPGLLFVFCVQQSSVRGCHFYFVLFILLLKCLNVRRFPPPSSQSTNCVTLVPKPGRKEGHAVREPSLLRGIAVLRRSGSRKMEAGTGKNLNTLIIK